MTQVIKKIKQKQVDGTYSDYIPIGAEAENVNCSDGESVEYKLNKKPYYYNSVADMKADTSLKIGDMAITLGYYEPNDGGRAEYKIVRTENGFIENLNNSLYATLILKDEMNIKQFGLKGDGNSSDDAIILNKCFNAVSSGIKINFNSTDIFNIQTGIVINKDIEIDGKNALINVLEDGLIVFDITNNSTKISNLNIDGSATVQDKFNATDYYSLKLIKGLSLISTNISLSNITLKNFYGEGIKIYKCQEFNAEFINIDNVGGRWYNNSYDAFGDAFYFNNSKPELNIHIKDCIVNMKYKNDVFSRSGLVLERNSDFPEAETYTNINIINSSFLNCDRCLHIENQNRKTNFIINNSKLYGHVWCINANQLEDNVLYFDKCELTQSGGNYSGTRGFRNCNINAKNSYFDTYNQTDALFMDCKVDIDNCTIDNISSTIFTDCLKTKIKNCIFNIYTNHYLRYSGTFAEIENSTFNNLTNEYMYEDGTFYNIINNCIFNNYIPKMINGINNKFYTTDDTIDIDYGAKGMGLTLYLNDNIISLPKSFRIFNYEDNFLTKYYRDEDISNGLSHTLIDNSRIIENGKKYILLIVGTASTVGLYDRIVSGFDYCVVTKENNNLSISSSTKIGSYNADYNISIDNINNTITKVGSYATKYQSLLLPYEYISCIGLI